jgi:hypothetical protein
MTIGLIKAVSDSFTRPADTTAYTAADLVANSVTAGSVVPLTFNVGRGGIRIAGIRLGKSTTTVTNATFSLHLFGTSPTAANGDNGAFSTTRADKIGIVALPIMVATSDVSFTTAYSGDTILLGGLYHYTSSGLVYGLLSAVGAYTPASAEVFDCKLIYERT